MASLKKEPTDFYIKIIFLFSAFLNDVPMSTNGNIETLIREIAIQARAASLSLAALNRDAKDAVLLDLAERLVAETGPLLEANKKDLEQAVANQLSGPMVERLTFTPERIQTMAEGVRQVAALEDPVGTELETIARPNGLTIRKVQVPIGVIGIIYESRPNVTIDCAVLCLKSGNASILRGGKEAFHTNQALAALIQASLQTKGLDPNAVQFIPTTDRQALNAMLKLDDFIHCIIPRGGESLIRFVAENSRIPVIKHYKGVCCLYVDKDVDSVMAESVVINSKCQRPGVCNALENLFVHQDHADTLFPQLAKALHEKGVELRAHDNAQNALQKANIPFTPATEEDFHEEYLDLILAVKLVDSTQAAIGEINRYGSGHSDGILTNNEEQARLFLQSVDSSTVYWNASTRFTDGFEFGLGAEIGISTDRLHARGPMGLRELCTYKYLVLGQGQIR